MFVLKHDDPTLYHGLGLFKQIGVHEIKVSCADTGV